MLKQLINDLQCFLMYKLLHQVNYVYMILQVLNIVICAICARTSCKENIYACFSGEKPSINRENPTYHLRTSCACSQVESGVLKQRRTPNLFCAKKSSIFELIAGLPPAFCWYPFIYVGGERHCESKVSCLRTQCGSLG